MQLISQQKAMDILKQYETWIAVVGNRYGVPTAAIKAILFQEATEINLTDEAADIVVKLGLPLKTDSSTGYMQIYGWVALNAANYAVDHGLATYESLGITANRRLDVSNKDDVHLVWTLISGNAKANIEFATLNMIVAADEVVGRTDIKQFSDEELTLVFSRYNAKTTHVTEYGKKAFIKYQEFLAQEGSQQH